MIKKIMYVLILLSIIIPGVYASGDAEQEGGIPRFIEIGTAGTGGAYYPIGIAMAEILTDILKTQATAQVTGGAVDNIRLIQEGSVKLAITSAASAYRGLEGIDPFTEPHTRISGLFGNLTQGIYQVAVRADSHIQDFYGLKGSRISLGPQGGLGVEMSKYAFEASGFTIDDVKATFLSYAESATMMADGNLDAIVIQSALPSPALKELQETGKAFRMISVPEEVIEKVHSQYPYYSGTIISASVYGMKADVRTLNSTNVIVIDSELPEETVYQITKALMSNISKINSSHPSAKAFNLKEAPEMPIPLHPGAERYYRENL